MGEIPEDCKKKAWSVLLEMDFKEKAHEKLDEVAKAIYAERQRCAKVAEDFSVTAYMHWDEHLEEPVKRKSPHALAISQAILADKEES